MVDQGPFGVDVIVRSGACNLVRISGPEPFGGLIAINEQQAIAVASLLNEITRAHQVAQACDDAQILTGAGGPVLIDADIGQEMWRTMVAMVRHTDAHIGMALTQLEFVSITTSGIISARAIEGGFADIQISENMGETDSLLSVALTAISGAEISAKIAIERLPHTTETNERN